MYNSVGRGKVINMEPKPTRADHPRRKNRKTREIMIARGTEIIKKTKSLFPVIASLHQSRKKKWDYISEDIKLLIRPTRFRSPGFAAVSSLSSLAPAILTRSVFSYNA